MFVQNKDNQKGWYLVRSVSPNSLLTTIFYRTAIYCNMPYYSRSSSFGVFLFTLFPFPCLSRRLTGMSSPLCFLTTLQRYYFESRDVKRQGCFGGNLTVSPPVGLTDVSALKIAPIGHFGQIHGPVRRAHHSSPVLTLYLLWIVRIIQCYVQESDTEWKCEAWSVFRKRFACDSMTDDS